MQNHEYDMEAIQALQETIRLQRDALEMYAQHTQNCLYWHTGKCDCGLNAFLKSLNMEPK